MLPISFNGSRVGRHDSIKTYSWLHCTSVNKANAKVDFHAIGHDRRAASRCNLRIVLSCKIIVADTAASNFVTKFFLPYQNLLIHAGSVSVVCRP